jgi:hypothetical protein
MLYQRNVSMIPSYGWDAVFEDGTRYPVVAWVLSENCDTGGSATPPVWDSPEAFWFIDGAYVDGDGITQAHEGGTPGNSFVCYDKPSEEARG